MQNKEERIKHIRQILSTHNISSQEELQQVIRKSGYFCTQATLSRDLKELKAVKTINAGGQYVIKVPDHSENSRDLNSLISGFDAVLWVRFSGNLGVIKTINGFASAIAIRIDSMKMKTLLGTVAGDDTVMVIIREGLNASDVRREIAETDEELFSKIQY